MEYGILGYGRMGKCIGNMLSNRGKMFTYSNGHNNADVAHHSDVLIVAVPNNRMEEVACEIRKYMRCNTHVISVATEVQMNDLYRMFDRRHSITRALPNLYCWKRTSRTPFLSTSLLTDDVVSDAFGRAIPVSSEKHLNQLAAVHIYSPALFAWMYDYLAHQTNSDGDDLLKSALRDVSNDILKGKSCESIINEILGKQ